VPFKNLPCQRLPCPLGEQQWSKSCVKGCSVPRQKIKNLHQVLLDWMGLKNTCEWAEGNEKCVQKQGEIDPIGGGTVKLTPDHKTSHSVKPAADTKDVGQWQALCGRHQVMKKNYWDSNTGKMNGSRSRPNRVKSMKLVLFRSGKRSTL